MAYTLGGRILAAASSGRLVCGSSNDPRGYAIIDGRDRPGQLAWGLMGTSRVVLDGVVERLRPLLAPLGFGLAYGEDAVSSGGPFATGVFARDPFHIDLIVRGDRLGLPNYRWDRTVAGHDDLVRALGRHEHARLRWDASAFRVVDRDGEAVADALVADLAGIILPVLQTRPDAVREAVVAAHAAFQRRLRGGRHGSR